MSRWQTEIWQALRDALWIFVYEAQHSGIGLLAVLAHRGVRGWAWLFLLTGSVLAGLALVTVGGPASSRTIPDGLLGVGFLALWLPFLWTLLVVTADNLPLAFRVLTALYSLYFLALPLLGTLPVETLLVPVLVLFVHERLRPASGLERWPGRLLWSLALAQFPPHLPGPLAASIGLKAAVGVGLAALPFWGQNGCRPMVRGGWVWLGLTLPYLLAWRRSPEGLMSGIEAALSGLWGLSVPLWLWLGANLVDEAGRLGRYCGRRAAILRTRPGLLGSLPIAAVLLALAAAPAFWPEVFRTVDSPLGVAYLPLLGRLREWPPDAYLSGKTAVWMLLLLGLVGLWLRRRADPAVFGVRYLELVVGAMAFAALFWQRFFAAPDPDLPAEWWPLFLVGLGWFWEPVKGLRELTEHGVELLEWLCALILLLLTLLVLRVLTNPGRLAQEEAVWTLLGAGVWGFPGLLIGAIRGTPGAGGLATSTRSFLLGYSLMMPLMSLLPLDTRWLATIAFGMGTAPTGSNPGEARWERWARAAWVGVGAVAFRAAPWLLPLPVLPLTQAGLERLLGRGALDFMSWDFVMAVGCALAAAIPAAWTDHPRRRWLGWGTGVGLWLAWNVGLPGPEPVVG